MVAEKSEVAGRSATVVVVWTSGAVGVDDIKGVDLAANAIALNSTA